MIPDEFGLAIGECGPVGHAVGHNRTLARTAFRVSAASSGSADQKSLFAAEYEPCSTPWFDQLLRFVSERSALVEFRLEGIVDWGTARFRVEHGGSKQ
jgi:hypothetical protein